jgi:hypothetical protein
MSTATKIQKDFEADEDRRKRESAQAQLEEITTGSSSQVLKKAKNKNKQRKP